ncbi:electron transport complex subunit E [Photobacterium sp. ZSDE20]|uniref:Ion-translocating oxidoreductase complex subunit E n=1 Tax=Photobacterium pectinilyticum TaxID=2906793 RepID=A0ABT1N1I1_9GAMM|nr:electron transport complex subunit E [Photobacterium sp. ZSDE20]MCQ1058591.1 electron transport complex subunit E [Photobacterium sp. ZSDE20]MDD1826287.1 electron transport complex subunit E [Photobacterium sp. ZSDE20]
MTSYKEIIKGGVWDNNIVLSQSLALCPLLAVTSTATNGLGLGIATLFVMVFASILTSLAKPIVSRAIRIPVNVLIIATLVTSTDLLLNAYFYPLHKVLGLFIPLIVTNCAILGRVEAFATKNKVIPSAVDALAMGFGFCWVLVVLGGVREVIGSGTLFSNASLMLGEKFYFIEQTIIPNYRGFLLAILPPGGFIAIGLLLGLKNSLERLKDKSQQTVEVM